MRFWLETYDFNLPLLDAVNDPAIEDLRAHLAALSLREGLDGGYYDAVTLADLVAHLWIESEDRVTCTDSEAQRALADLLDQDGSRYVVALYAAVKAMPHNEAASHLRWLADLMKLRADMYRVARTAGVLVPAVPGR